MQCRPFSFTDMSISLYKKRNIKFGVQQSFSQKLIVAVMIWVLVGSNENIAMSDGEQNLNHRHA